MNNEDYAQIRNILTNTINNSIATNQFRFDMLIPQMETEFKRLGFRSNSGGGGVQKILLLRLDAVGDFILLTPSIRAIRENFPRAFITLVVTKPVYPMAEFCPYVNEVIPFDTPFKSSIDNKDVLNILMTTTDFSAKYLWKRQFDISFSFLYDWTHSLMAYMSGAKTRIAPARDIATIFATSPVPVDYHKIFHWCDKNLHLPRACGLKTNSTDLELWIEDEDIRRAQEILGDFAKNRLKIAVGLGANHVERRYPVDKYLAAFKRIVSKGASLVILGGPSEVDDAKFLESKLPKGTVKNITEIRPGWRVDAAIISMTDMYIGNDTGTQHVAAVLKKPVIVVSRVSKDRQRLSGGVCESVMFEPWQTKHITLQPEHSLGECANNNWDCGAGKPHCITQIKPSEIVAAYEKILR